MLTQCKLKEYLSYCTITGEFKWVKKPNRNIILGSKAGCLDVNKYVKISLLGVSYYGHRLAFLYVEGSFPDSDVDHIDGNPSNLVWTNLRKCTRGQNNQNARRNSRNTSGVKGVSICNRTGKWKVTLISNGVSIHGGYFKTLTRAEDRIKQLRISHHKEFANHG